MVIGSPAMLMVLAPANNGLKTQVPAPMVSHATIAIIMPATPKALCLKAYEPGIREQAVEMAINGSGIRDTGRVLGISKTTVLNTLKTKENILIQVNPDIRTIVLGADTKIHVGRACDQAEMDVSTGQ